MTDQITAEDFKQALKSNQISFVYQPILALHNGFINGFEALMRWNHPEHGFISPGVFIPLAEQSGLIIEASRLALTRACEDLKTLQYKYSLGQTLVMSINFTSKDLAEEDFIAQLDYICQKTDTRLEQIRLEITEDMLISQPEHAQDILNMCRSGGLSVALDDFMAASTTTLEKIKSMPIDTLKIDNQDVNAMLTDSGIRKHTQDIISEAQQAGIELIAEGVEEKEEALLLRDLGCDMAQGYFFAKPMKMRDATELVENWWPLKLDEVK